MSEKLVFLRFPNVSAWIFNVYRGWFSFYTADRTCKKVDFPMVFQGFRETVIFQCLVAQILCRSASKSLFSLGFPTFYMDFQWFPCVVFYLHGCPDLRKA